MKIMYKVYFVELNILALLGINHYGLKRMEEKNQQYIFLIISLGFFTKKKQEEENKQFF